MTSRDDWGGPYVGVACFCREIDINPRNALHTYVDVGDTITIDRPDDTVSLHLAVGVYAAEQSGHAQFTVSIIAPDGSRAGPAIQDTKSFKDGRGFTHWFVPMHLDMMPGTYWFEVQINGRFLTKVPLTVELRQPEQMR